MIATSTYPRAHLVILALILLLAGTLRFFCISALGFWTDEFCALSAAHGHGLQLARIPMNQILPPTSCCTKLADANSFWQIPAAMASDDAHPPLYFMLLRLWEDLLGDSETAVRSLNVVFSLLAIALLYFASRESVGSSTALVACLLMTVATPQIQYAQEARNYMPVLVFALITFIAIGRLKRSGNPAYAFAIMLGLLATMLTHYLAAGAAAGLGLYAMFCLRNRARKIAAISFTTAGVLFAALWGWAIIKQQPVINSSSLTWLIDKDPGHLQRRLLDLCRLPVRFFAEITDPNRQLMIGILGAGMLTALPVLIVRRRELRPWIYWLVCAVGIIALADIRRSTTQLNWVRYSLFATPPAYVLLAAAIRGRGRYIAPLIAAITAIFCLQNAYIPAWKMDFRTPASNIANRLASEDGLVFTGPNAKMNAVMFAGYRHYLPGLHATIAVLDAAPSGATLRRLQQCRHVWVISLWNDSQIPGFEIQERAKVPYDLMLGRFTLPATTAQSRPGDGS